MTAYDAFTEILDINETIEALKDKNMGDQPDKALCRAVFLLAEYRSFLSEGMRSTILKFDGCP